MKKNNTFKCVCGFGYNELLSEPPSTLYIKILVVILSVFLAGFCIFVNLFGLCIVSQTSMTNTLYDGDKLLVLNNPNTISVNDIVIIKDASDDLDGKLIIKRVVAVGGETIKFVTKGNYVYLYKLSSDGEFYIYDEDYIKETMLKSFFIQYGLNRILDVPITISEDCYYVLGDNRNGSLDSRSYDEFSNTQIIGKMVYKIKEGGLFESILDLVYNIF